MLKFTKVLSFFVLIYTFYFGYVNTNSSAAQAQTRFSATGDCNVSFDPKTNELKLVSKITVNAQTKRARCIVRINTFNAQKQFRLVPVALKGEVKKAPATVAISSILIGGQPTRLSKKYTSSAKFDLTNQIPSTNYTTQGKSVFGINLVLTTTGGELELTDMRFALQQR